MIKSKKTKYTITALFLVMAISVCLLSACGNDKLLNARDDRGGEEIELNVPLEQLAPFIAPAKTAIKEQLGIDVPADAHITFSEFNDYNNKLEFTWYGYSGLGDYSVTFQDVNLSAGTGTVIYVRTQGAEALALTSALALQAENAFAEMLGTPILPGSRLEATLSIDDGQRSVWFSWYPVPQLETSISPYAVCYEEVSKEYDEGTLVVLTTEQKKCLILQDDPDQSVEIEYMRAMAESFLSTQGMEDFDFLRYEKERDTDHRRGDAYFYFDLREGKYGIMTVSVNADGRVTGFFLNKN